MCLSRHVFRPYSKYKRMAPPIAGVLPQFDGSNDNLVNPFTSPIISPENIHRQNLHQSLDSDNIGPFSPLGTTIFGAILSPGALSPPVLRSYKETALPPSPLSDQKLQKQYPITPQYSSQYPTLQEDPFHPLTMYTRSAMDSLTSSRADVAVMDWPSVKGMDNNNDNDMDQESFQSLLDSHENWKDKTFSESTWI